MVPFGISDFAELVSVIDKRLQVPYTDLLQKTKYNDFINLFSTDRTEHVEQTLAFVYNWIL